MSGVIKFFTLLRQNKDLEILEHNWLIWASNDKYSSNKIPSSLKFFVSPSL
jgi:hypothetical protein